MAGSKGTGKDSDPEKVVPGPSSYGAKRRKRSRIGERSFSDKNKAKRPRVARKMGSVTGHTEESMILHLPPEMLDKIMSYLTDRRDLMNCYRAVPILDKVLHPRKPVFLFGDVLPHLFHHLPYEDLINLRQVCQQWHQDVDQFTDRLPIRAAHSDSAFLTEMNSSVVTRKNLGATRLSTFNPWTTISPRSPRFPEFWNHVQQLLASGKSPFFCNSLQLVGTRPGEEVQENEDFFPLMTDLGDHLKHLRVHLNVTDAESLLTSFDLIVWLLQCTPHLQTLSVQITGARDVHLVPQLLEMLQTMPCMAHVPNLTSLEISPRDKDMLGVWFEIFGTPYLHQLTKLTLCHWPEYGTLKLDLLKELTLWKVRRNKDLRYLLQVEAPALEKLSLAFGFQTVNPMQLNQVIKRYPQLRVLALEWRNSPDPTLLSAGSSISGNRHVPTLHTLYIQHGKEVHYSLLGWFPNLRFLYLTELTPWEMPMEEEEATSSPVVGNVWRVGAKGVNLHQHLNTGDLTRSNLWNVMRELEFVAYHKVRPQNLETLQESLMRESGDEEHEMIRRFWKRPRPTK